MALRDVLLQVTTDATGDGTSSVSQPLAGWIVKIRAEDDGLDDAHTWSLANTNTESGTDETLWSTTAGDTNSDASFYPKVQNTDAAADAISGQYDRIFFSGKLQATVGAGGNAKTGALLVHVMDLN